MRLDDYSCRVCQHEFEALVTDDDPATVCPACASPEVKRELSGFAIARGGADCATGTCPPSFGGGCANGACGL